MRWMKVVPTILLGISLFLFLGCSSQGKEIDWQDIPFEPNPRQNPTIEIQVISQTANAQDIEFLVVNDSAEEVVVYPGGALLKEEGGPEDLRPAYKVRVTARSDSFDPEDTAPVWVDFREPLVLEDKGRTVAAGQRSGTLVVGSPPTCGGGWHLALFVKTGDSELAWMTTNVRESC
jgi:hypothetical protein